MNEPTPSPHKVGQAPSGFSRRSLLVSLVAAVALTVLTRSWGMRRAGASHPDVRADGLDRFLRLSSLLTGFDTLREELARLYMRSLLEHPVHASALADLYEKGGFLSSKPPRTLEELTATGIFEDARLRATADALTLVWYSGVYESRSGPAVATFTETLAWKALTYTKAPTVCGGGMGFWAEPPRV